MEKVDNIQEQLKNENRKMEIIIKNKEMLTIKKSKRNKGCI
jgi:hypothetical protein